MKVDLSKFDNRDFDRGRSALVEVLWRGVSALFFQSPCFPFSAPKRFLLRLFGAKVGKKVLLKSRLFITLPWKVEIGDHSWIGEEVWLDSLDQIRIGDHCCVSQRAYLGTGSHDAKKSTFDLVTKPIELEEGVWVGAGVMIAPGVQVGEHAFLTLGSVVTRNVSPRTVVAGNPATTVRQRDLLT